MRLSFVGASNTNKSLRVSAQQTINQYPEIDPQGKFQTALHARPGLKTFAAAGSDPVRGIIPFSGDLYAVVGQDLRKITTGGVVSVVGTITTATGPVGISKNATQIMIVDGTAGYISDGSTLTQITDADFPDTATQVVFLDGYFIVNDPTTAGKFQISALNDGTSWDAADFATAERSPDALTALLVKERELWLFGDDTVEPWFNSGNPDFPFEPIQSAFTEWGIAAPFSAAKIDNAVFWIAKNEIGCGMAFMARGFRGVRISTHAVEEAWAKYSTIADGIAFTMECRGHFFYVVTFPTGNETWVYDMTTNLWHEWSTFGVGRFRGNVHTLLNGVHYVGDFQDGSIYTLDFDTYTDAGTVMERIRQDRHIVDIETRRPAFHRRLEIEFEQGVGTDTLDPQVMMQWSDDGGFTWSNEYWRGTGNIGQYARRCVWRNLGRSRDRIYRTKVTDDAKSTIVGAWVELQ